MIQITLMILEKHPQLSTAEYTLSALISLLDNTHPNLVIFVPKKSQFVISHYAYPLLLTF